MGFNIIWPEAVKTSSLMSASRGVGRLCSLLLSCRGGTEDGRLLIGGNAKGRGLHHSLTRGSGIFVAILLDLDWPVCYTVCCQNAGLGPETVDFSTGALQKGVGYNILRPEAVESICMLYRITNDTIYREWGWQMFQAFEQYSKVSAQHLLRTTTRQVRQEFQISLEGCPFRFGPFFESEMHKTACWAQHSRSPLVPLHCQPSTMHRTHVMILQKANYRSHDMVDLLPCRLPREDTVE